MLFRTWFCPMPTSPGTKMIDGLVSPQDPHSFANHRQLLHTNTRQDKISSLSTYVQENTNQITGLSMIKTNCEVAPRICGHELKHCACRARNNCALSETIGATLKKNATSPLNCALCRSLLCQACKPCRPIVEKDLVLLEPTDKNKHRSLPYRMF